MKFKSSLVHHYHNVVELLSADFGHGGVLGRVTHRQTQQQLFVVRPAQQPPELRSGIQRGRGQRDEAGVLHRGDEQTGGDGARYFVVVVGLPLAVGGRSVGLFEEQHDVGGLGQVLLDVVGLEELEIRGPLFAHPLLVVRLLLLLDDPPDLLLEVLIRHDHVGPGLGVGAARRRSRRPDDVLQNLSGHRFVAEEPQSPSAVHRFVKIARLLDHFVLVVSVFGFERDVFRVFVDDGFAFVVAFIVRIGVIGGLATLLLLFLHKLILYVNRLR